MEKKVFVYFAIFVLVLSLSLVTSYWEDIESEDEPNENLENSKEESQSSDNLENSFQDTQDSSSYSSSGDSYEYTLEYKLAWIFSGIALLIILYLIHSFLKPPRNKWEK